MRAHARTSVEHLLSFDGACDFMNDFALHYPLRVIMSLFGVPPEDEPFMLKLDTSKNRCSPKALMIH